MIGDIRLVLDTDMLRSGLQSMTGASRLLLCAVAEGALRPLPTVAMLLEHEEVLLRPDSLAATGLTAEATLAFLDAYAAQAEPVIVRRRTRSRIRDPADEMFVEALLDGEGDAIVSFNRRD